MISAANSFPTVTKLFALSLLTRSLTFTISSVIFRRSFAFRVPSLSFYSPTMAMNGMLLSSVLAISNLSLGFSCMFISYDTFEDQRRRGRLICSATMDSPVSMDAASTYTLSCLMCVPCYIRIMYEGGDGLVNNWKLLG